MAADITFGSYDTPAKVGTSRPEWIIVSCWGSAGEYLSLSLTNQKAGSLGSAPRGLQPATTFLGLLLTDFRTGDREEAEYLFIRHRPTDITVGGCFHPSDGYARVVREGGELRVTARGRFAHCHGVLQGEPVVKDIPQPAPGYAEARAWHATGVRRPWIGEFNAGPGYGPGEISIGSIPEGARSLNGQAPAVTDTPPPGTKKRGRNRCPVRG